MNIQQMKEMLSGNFDVKDAIDDLTTDVEELLADVKSIKKEQENHTILLRGILNALEGHDETIKQIITLLLHEKYSANHAEKRIDEITEILGVLIDTP
ncbi:hypothetical protein [Endozoicomonas sp. SCSIO W0465]|uniref:hypothetical protein n=1 Tax=Endozoicomonas sp. SCSIO W0465 TaxID=2918516 RepID=UPI0020751569|nr:hypothetical protein [Endozoicomonas sp. SCSIO W0465]USE39506.1 hypothetical protein MJO57_15890 [Endozoicomonas sp. SCSIO W0465]